MQKVAITTSLRTSPRTGVAIRSPFSRMYGIVTWAGKRIATPVCALARNDMVFR